METQILVTQSFVLLPDETRYTLEYYLDCQTTAEVARYGITIKAFQDDALTDCASVTCPHDECVVLDYIQLFARNFLFPCSLSDVAEDMHVTTEQIAVGR